MLCSYGRDRESVAPVEVLQIGLSIVYYVMISQCCRWFHVDPTQSGGVCYELFQLIFVKFPHQL